MSAGAYFIIEDHMKKIADDNNLLSLPIEIKIEVENIDLRREHIILLHDFVACRRIYNAFYLWIN